jgi:hypothetical protein
MLITCSYRVSSRLLLSRIPEVCGRRDHRRWRCGMISTKLFALLRDEEVITMAQQLLTHEDLEELKQFPMLWRSYQEGERQRARLDILEVLAARFDPPISAYQQAEQALTTIDEPARLSELLRRALRVADLATFLHELGAGSERPDGTAAA